MLELHTTASREDRKLFDKLYSQPVVSVIHGTNGRRDVRYWTIGTHEITPQHDGHSFELVIEHDFSGDPDRARRFTWDAGDRYEIITREERDDWVETAQSHGVDDFEIPDNVHVDSTDSHDVMWRVLEETWQTLNLIADFTIAWGEHSGMKENLIW